MDSHRQRRWSRDLCCFCLVMLLLSAGLVLWTPRSVQAQTGCYVGCIGSACWKANDGNYYQTQGGAVCNYWYVTTIGCTPATCNCTNPTVAGKYQQAAPGANTCDPIQTNTAVATGCKNLGGKLFNVTCCQGCTAK